MIRYIGYNQNRLANLKKASTHTRTRTQNTHPCIHPPNQQAHTHARTHIRTLTHARTHTHTQIYTRIPACTQTHACTHARTHTLTHLHTCTHAHIAKNGKWNKTVNSKTDGREKLLNFILHLSMSRKRTRICSWHRSKWRQI